MRNKKLLLAFLAILGLVSASCAKLQARDNLNRGVRALAISPDFGNDRTVFAGVWRDNIYRVRD